MDGFISISLNDMLKSEGEDRVKSILSNFSCPLNKDVEQFIKNKAIEFDKQGIAATHLIFTSFKGLPVFIAYYSLTIKYIVIEQFGGRRFSASLRTRIKRFLRYDNQIKKYIMNAPLIAQLGKNFYNNYDKLITGDELLKMACDTVREGQRAFGGKFVYLECEDKVKLTSFYGDNGFVNFNNRPLDKDEKDDFSGEYLVQMIKFLK